LAIAATQKLTQKGKVWLVPSASGNGKKYTVLPESQSPFCSCPDFEETGQRCKHIYAVRFTVTREQAKDGTVTETRTVGFSETPPPRRLQGNALSCNEIYRKLNHCMTKLESPQADLEIVYVHPLY
jgi:hypothetical protein